VTDDELAARTLARYERLRPKHFDPAKPRESLLAIARVILVEATEDLVAQFPQIDLAAFLDTPVSAITLYGAFVEMLELEGLEEPTEDEIRLIHGRHHEAIKAKFDAIVARMDHDAAQEGSV
jgi:hypothetical protein